MTRFILRQYTDGGKNGRKHAGILLGIVGIVLDLFLFAVKYLAGILSGSIAVTADAFNNLGDAGAQLTVLLGFVVGDKKPTKAFPFGCGRLEYLSGLVIATAILFVSGKMMISSVEKIIRPEAVDSSPTVILILLVSIAVKGYMYIYNKRIGERIDSTVLRSVAVDSVCDCFATAAIILSIVVQKLTGIPIDGWTGLMVGVCILYAGIIAAKENLSPLLGLSVDEETLLKLYAMLEKAHGIHTVDEIAVHDYGPGRKLMTMRISGKLDSSELSELKARIKERLNMDTVVEIKEIDTQPHNHRQSRQE